ncbi:maleylpyruvate isomerase family mycothiol-dependent enzyme [Streptomyces sp. ODS28]|uniref:maleylpyruvate isomerase family mycothiol-dependent enzyme n=1 Tax=Streptomyces sp. ODS28 TaxID=3136688 RepID=UPI0031EBE13E
MRPTSGTPGPSGAASDGHPLAEPLLGAWLLNACSPEEAALVEAHLRHCEHCASDAHTLRAALPGLAGSEPLPPPPELYERTTTAAFAARTPTPRGLPAHVRPYAAQLATLDAVLRELAPADWRSVVVEGWTAAQLVSHLAATDSLLAEQLAGAPSGDTVPERTAAYTSWAARHPYETVHATWYEAAASLRESLSRGDPSRPAELAAGFPLPVADHAVGRAFETWIHTRDIALTTSRTLPPPSPETLHAMSDLGARLLPKALLLTGTPLDSRALTLHLTGEGGGTWQVGPGTTTAELTLDTVDFCLLTGGRLGAGEIPRTVTGDAGLAEAALGAAGVFSGP